MASSSESACSLLCEFNGSVDGHPLQFGWLCTRDRGSEPWRWHLRRVLPTLGFHETPHQSLSCIAKRGWPQWVRNLKGFGLEDGVDAGKSRKSQQARFLGVALRLGSL